MSNYHIFRCATNEKTKRNYLLEIRTRRSCLKAFIGNICVLENVGNNFPQKRYINPHTYYSESLCFQRGIHI